MTLLCISAVFNQKQDSGVSPVIGVILMVAVTVALVALVTVTVFDIGGEVSESPDATVQLEQENGNITATLLRNENVQELYLQQGSNSWGDTDAQESDSGYASPMQNSGDVISTSEPSDSATDSGTDGTVDVGTGADGAATGDPVNVIAVMSDGSEEVLTTTELE